MKHKNLNGIIPDGGNYSIATIRRKSDNKLFGCYFRNGSVKIIKDGDVLGYKNWFIEKGTGDEELCLYGIDQKVYDIIEVVEEYPLPLTVCGLAKAGLQGTKVQI
jgi:hypothetical protein